MRDEIGVRLWIISENLSPREIDKHVGIKCDDLQIRGEMNRLGTKRYDRNAWVLKSKRVIDPGEYIGEKIGSQIGEFLSRISGATERIKELSQSHEVDFSLYFYAQDVPPMNLPKEHVKAIAALGASLDIDLIIYANPEGEKPQA